MFNQQQDDLMTELALLAMVFRRTKEEDKRKDISKKYAVIIFKLIAIGNWDEMPPLEDMLPDAYMPKDFKEFLRLK